MNKVLRLFLFFFLTISCSLDKKSGLWTKADKIENAKDLVIVELFKEEKNFDNEFNSNIRIQLKSKLSKNSFSNNLSNNNGRVDYDGNLKTISKYKFSKIDNFNRFEADTNFDGVIDVDLSGNPVQRAPENQFMLEALYQSPGLSNGGSLDWNLRVSYEDDQVASYSAAGSEFDTLLKAKSLVDMNITYTDPQDRYYVSLIGRNLGDKRYVQGSLSVATLWVMAAYGPPRYLGIQFGTRLGR